MKRVIEEFEAIDLWWAIPLYYLIYAWFTLESKLELARMIVVNLADGIRDVFFGDDEACRRIQDRLKDSPYTWPPERRE